MRHAVSSLAPLAYALGVGFVPIRKKVNCLRMRAVNLSEEYEPTQLKFSRCHHQRAKRTIIDDLLATGGTIKANIELVEKLGGNVVGLGFLIEQIIVAAEICLATSTKYSLSSLQDSHRHLNPPFWFFY